ncbi:MAG: ATP-binding cassette domain-containing protein, partial [Gaiellaceae bacterium]
FKHSHTIGNISVTDKHNFTARRDSFNTTESSPTDTELLGLLGISAQADARASALAHGDERKLEVARALAIEPRFVLMDEPAAGLPEAEIPNFANVLRTVRDEQEAGVLLIDHNMALVMEVCDRIHVLDQGRTLAEGTPDAVRGNLDVTAAYLGESAVHEGASDDRS